MITQKELKELLDYNPGTGFFTWKEWRKNSVQKGDIAGSHNDDGYIRIEIKRQKYRAHRLAFLYMEGRFPKLVDHINHIRDDNRWCNLREIKQVENNRNCSIRKDNKSGVIGVHWVTRDKRWVASIRIHRKDIRLGNYKDKFEAICARKSAERKHGFHENHGR